MARRPRRTARRQPPEIIHLPPRVERIIDVGIAEIVQQTFKRRRK